MIETSTSLLARLRTDSDPQGWSRLVALYSPWILTWVRRAGVHSHDADDVVQDVLGELVRAIPTFQYDPDRGHFRSWLRTMTV